MRYSPTCARHNVTNHLNKEKENKEMKRKLETRIITFALSLLMATNFACVDIAKAAEMENTEQVESGRTNYSFDEIEDYDNIHYTYEEDGKTYSVYESVNDTMTESSTEVYVLNGDEEVLVEEYTTRMETIAGALYMCKYENGVLVDQRFVDTVAEEEHSNAMFARAVYNGKVYYEGSTRRYFTGWYYAYQDIGSHEVERLSLTAVAFIVGGIFGIRYKSEYLAAGVYEISKKVIDLCISEIYWKKDVYEVSQIKYPERTYYGSNIGMRVFSKIYADKAKTNLIESKKYESKTSEWPSTITIGNA